MQKVFDSFFKKDFWIKENLRYADPYFRLEKCARIVNNIAGNEPRDLLDIGCGPGSLQELLNDNINYFGIDIAIHKPAPNLMERDLSQEEIGYDDRTFDLVVAGGLFEYMGGLQEKKLAEVKAVLRKNGRFILTYTNFSHVNDSRIDHSIYNNIQHIEEFKRGLECFFTVDSWFPSSHNWQCSEPRRKLLKVLQLPLQRRLPLISRWLAVNYFFICSHRDH